MKGRHIALALLAVLTLHFSTVGFAATVGCGVSAEETDFVPSWGKVVVNEDQYTRYVIQYMYWDKYARLSALWGLYESTFEPDVIFYNYDGNAYGDAPIGYWESNLPRPYVDTQAFDGQDEKAVTIGSADAASILAQTMYHTVTRMTDGGGNSSQMKLSSQRGKRSPSQCYTTACSFGCRESPNNVKAVPFGAEVLPTGTEFSVPGCMRYWYDWKYYMRDEYLPEDQDPKAFFYGC
jgi:hypothetical protein